MRRIVTIAAFFSFACAEPPPEKPTEPLPPVHAETRVDEAVVTTGDVITYEVIIEYDDGYDVEVPELGSQIAGLRVIDLGRDPPKVDRGRTRLRRWYQLRADLVGSYILPPLKLQYRKVTEDSDAAGDNESTSLETSEIFVEVESVLPQDGEVRDIRDLKPLRYESFGPPRWLIGVIALGLLLAVAIPGVLFWRRKKSVELPPPPPHELAYAALDDLRGTNFSDPAALRKYYFALSEVIRAYVKGRFGVNATELTTEEIVPQIAALDELAPADQMRLREFLTETDLVKFAGHRPSDPEVEGTYEKALTFIEATIPPPEPEGEAEAQAEATAA